MEQLSKCASFAVTVFRTITSCVVGLRGSQCHLFGISLSIGRGVGARLGQRPDNGAHLFGSVSTNHLIILELVADVDISEKTVEKASCTRGIHTHEDLGDGVRDDKDDYKRTNWRVDIRHKLRVTQIEQDVGNNHIGDAYGQLSDEIEQSTESSSEHEAGSVL